jgi:hypothetical protein
MWSIQDSLLQSYRSFFLNSESILLGIAIFAAQSKLPWFAYFPAIPGLWLYFQWTTITHSRGLDVFYFHWLMLKLEAGHSVPADVMTQFKEWQRKDPAQRLAVLKADPLGNYLLGSPTRKKLDVVLPHTFLWFWVVVILVSSVLTLRAGWSLYAAHHNHVSPWEIWNLLTNPS